MREERDHVAGQGLRIEVNDEDDVLVVVVVVMLLRRLVLLVASVWAEPLGTCCVWAQQTSRSPDSRMMPKIQ